MPKVEMSEYDAEVLERYADSPSDGELYAIAQKIRAKLPKLRVSKRLAQMQERLDMAEAERDFALNDVSQLRRRIETLERKLKHAQIPVLGTMRCPDCNAKALTAVKKRDT